MTARWASAAATAPARVGDRTAALTSHSQKSESTSFSA